MRILIISSHFYPENFRINDFAKTLKNRGHQVTVLTGLPHYPKGKLFDGYSFWGITEEDYFGVRVVRVPIITRGKGRSIRLALNYLSFILSSLFLGLPRVKSKYDVSFVFASSPITSCIPAIALKRWTNTPVYLWVQDLWPESIAAVGHIDSQKIVQATGRLVKWIYQRCDKIFIQSRAFKDSVLKWGGKPEQLVYFPNWAEDFYSSKQELPKIDHEFPAGFNLLFAGNLGKAQSLDTLIEAAKKLKNQNINFIFLGDGSEKAHLQKQAQGLDHVYFWDRRPPEQMPSYFKQSDALLVSLTDDPIFSLVIPSKVQTYLAAGRPIIGSLNGEGARIIEESDSGLVAAAENAETLAKNIKVLSEMSEKETYKKALNGRTYYQKHFNKENLMKQFEELVKS